MMGKRLIAFVCAAALAFGAPAVAFGDTFAEIAAAIFQHVSRVTEGDDYVYTASNVPLQEDSNGVVEGTIEAFRCVRYGAASATQIIGHQSGIHSAPKPYDVDSSLTVLDAISFDLFFYYDDLLQTDEVLPNVEKGASLEFTYKANPDLVEQLATEKKIKTSDIHLIVYDILLSNGATEQLKDVLAANPVTVNIPKAQSATYVFALVCDSDLLNAKPDEPSDDPIVDPSDPSDPTAPDSPVSPKPNTGVTKGTIAGYDSGADASPLRFIPVVGSTDVSARGMLDGANTPSGSNVFLRVKKLASGDALDDLRAATRKDELANAYDVSLYVNDEVVHDGFGEITLRFTVGYPYEGKTATVWHRHNNGSITHESVTVENGAVTFKVTDLSSFAIEIDGSSVPVKGSATSQVAQPDDGTTSPKTGQSAPSAAPVLTLVAFVTALGTFALLANRRRNFR